jgi:hypothetical protein
MKKFIVILCLLICVLLAGCGIKDTGEMYFGDRFQVQEKIDEYSCVLIDKETGVNYLYIRSGYARTITVIYDQNGNVLISK